MPRFDPLTREERSERMSRVRNADTKPEMIVRRLVSDMGYRYNVYAGDILGKPDIVFPRRRKAIFVHGCFWHQHGCGLYRMPKTRRAFWEPKLARNKARDRRVRRTLRGMGWGCMVVWECRLKQVTRITGRIRRFLETRR